MACCQLIYLAGITSLDTTIPLQPCCSRRLSGRRVLVYMDFEKYI